MNKYKEQEVIKKSVKDNVVVLNNIQMFSKYKCLAQESIYNTLEKTTKNSNILKDENRHYSCKSITKDIVSLSVPTIVFYFIMFSLQTICLSFIGMKNNNFMSDGYGLINMFLTCTISCVLTGIVSGLDTLLPNAWGQKNMRLFNIYANRAKILSLSVGLVLVVFNYFFAVKILSLFQEGGDMKALSFGSQYLPLALITSILESQFSINFTILAIINKIKEVLIGLVISFTLHFLWCYTFIVHYDLGIVGAGLSSIFTHLVNYLFTSILIHQYNQKHSPKLAQSSSNDITDINSSALEDRIELSPQLSSEVLSGLYDYFQFILPNTLLLAAEWMAFEIQGLMAFSMDAKDEEGRQYSVHNFLTNIAHLTNTFSSGFGMATAILIAEKVGKLIIKESKLIAVYSFIIAQGVMSTIVVVILLSRNMIFHLFTTNQEIIDLGRQCIIYLAIFTIVDATQAVMAGAFRGYGKQKIASIIALIQYYIVQTILSWYIGFHLGKGVVGIWMSILIGGITTTIIYFVVFILLDFNKIEEETKARLEIDNSFIKVKYSEIELSDSL